VTVHGVLAAATVDAATDADVFMTFVRAALVPALRPGQVVVMDNLAAHKVAGVRDLIEAAGCRLVYLPPYSPDLSPIEPMWSKLKQALRTTGARAAAALDEAVGSALATITAADCLGYFRHCGYTLHLK
jgi:transposase